MIPKLTILIIDESPIYRDLLSKSLNDVNDIQVAGTCPNEGLAIKKIHSLNPDILLLDVSMKELQLDLFIKNIVAEKPQLGIILTCYPDELSAAKTLSALQYGAYDFIVKPEAESDINKIEFFKRIIPSKIRTFSTKKYSILTRSLTNMKPQEVSPTTHLKNNSIYTKISSSLPSEKSKDNKYDVILIGASTGGPDALIKLLPFFPTTFQTPIIIAIHMPKLFTSSLAQYLSKKSKLNVVEATDGTIISPNKVYIIQGGQNAKLVQENNFVKISFENKSIKNPYTPSIDIFFESASKIYYKKIIAILLTGMGTDGTLGMKKIKDLGGTTIVQDEDSSVVWGMPKSAINAKCVDEIVPIEEIAQHVINHTLNIPLNEINCSIPINPFELDLLRKYILKISGINISEEKSYLFTTRLEGLLKTEKFSNFTDFYNHMSDKFDIRLQNKIIELITTNETSFFRDKHPFDSLAKHLLPIITKSIKKELNPKIRIWSAGCSTGDEPYSIAITILEWLKTQNFLRDENFKIIASDISQKVLDIAKKGHYNFTESDNIPKNILNEYFIKKDDFYEIKPAIKKMIFFNDLNLIDPFEHLGTFHIVFCRNVLIYLSPSYKDRIIEKFYNILPKHGVLIIGASESLYKMSSKFKGYQYMNTIYYMPNKF